VSGLDETGELRKKRGVHIVGVAGRYTAAVVIIALQSSVGSDTPRDPHSIRHVPQS
jgi:hypothetical protein